MFHIHPSIDKCWINEMYMGLYFTVCMWTDLSQELFRPLLVKLPCLGRDTAIKLLLPSSDITAEVYLARGNNEWWWNQQICSHIFFSPKSRPCDVFTNLVFEICQLFKKCDGYISDKLQENPFWLWYLKLSTIHQACNLKLLW